MAAIVPNDQIAAPLSEGPTAKFVELNGNHEQGPAGTMFATQKPVLILINPHSGRGKSIKIFKKQVEKILSAFNVTHDVFVTTKDTRIKEYLNTKTLDQLKAYKSIIVVSGDGLLYETVNAMMSRPDWQQAMEIPIGLIPTGSGNGMAHTLIRLSEACAKTDKEAVRVCCEQAVQSESCFSDLVKITYGQADHDETNNSTTIWSFLSIGWGLLADIDIDSEWLRCMGEFRFTLYGVLKALMSVSHRGRLSYVVAPEHSQELKSQLANESNADATMYQADHSEHEKTDSNNDWIHIEDRFVCLYAVHQPYVNSSTKFAPASTLTDQLTYLTYIRGRLSAHQALKFLLSIEDGSHAKLPFVRVVPVKLFKFQPLDRSKVVVDGETINWDLSQGALRAEVVPKMLKLAWSPSSSSASS